MMLDNQGDPGSSSCLAVPERRAPALLHGEQGTARGRLFGDQGQDDEGFREKHRN